MSDGESIQKLHRCLARMEAATTRAAAAFDAGGTWQADGARSASAWLARRCGLPSSTARRRIRLGRELRHLSVAEAAWLAGKLGEAQVAALVCGRPSESARWRPADAAHSRPSRHAGCWRRGHDSRAGAALDRHLGAMPHVVIDAYGMAAALLAGGAVRAGEAATRVPSPGGHDRHLKGPA